MKTLKASLLILLCFFQTEQGFASGFLSYVDGEAKENFIKYLSDPQINNTNTKVDVLSSCIDDLDVAEIQSMILPEISTLNELIDLLDNCEDQKKRDVISAHPHFGPLAKFLRSVNDILVSEHPNDISQFLETYKIDKPISYPSSPSKNLKQLVAELEIWNYMFYELADQINELTTENIKRSADSLIIENLGIVHLVEISEQFMNQGIFINLISDDFWVQFKPQLQASLERFPFEESLKTNKLEDVVKDAVNFVFIASQLASQLSPVSNYASQSSLQIDEWQRQEAINFLRNLSLPQGSHPLVKSKLSSLNHLIKSSLCESLRTKI